MIRHATPDDAPVIADLIHRTIAVSYAGPYSPGAIAFAQALHDTDAVVARMARGPVLMAQAGDRIVATGALDGDRIFGLFVDPACQGGGYGKRIMDALEGAALAQGFKEVSLFVSVPAYDFYVKRGYTIHREMTESIGQGDSIRFWDASKAL